MAKTARFDGGAFFAALDAERQARQCTWKQVAEECGISASTLSRMSQGKHPRRERSRSVSGVVRAGCGQVRQR